MNHGEKNNEYLLEIPMWEEYVSETKSDIADFKNDSGNNAGGIMPGAFLSNFIPKNTNWVHLDIASIDYLHSETKMRYKGATGNIIRTLFDFSKEKGLTNDL